MDFEYGVIGGGPAGYTVAMNLAKKGAKVVLLTTFQKSSSSLLRAIYTNCYMAC